MNYQLYLSSTEWQAKASERKAIDNNACCVCSSTENLNVHHLSYRNIGNEDVKQDLRTLCQSCHAMLHRIQRSVPCGQMIADKVLCKANSLILRDFIRQLRACLLVEIFLRDKVNGGDLDLAPQQQIRKIVEISVVCFQDALIEYDQFSLEGRYKHCSNEPKAVLNHIYSAVGGSTLYGGDFFEEIFHEYDIVRTSIKCKMFRRIKDEAKTAEIFGISKPNLHRTLCRYSWDKETNLY